MDMKKHHPNKTPKELLTSAIHAYGINMYCAGKYHGQALKDTASSEKIYLEQQEKHYSESADDILKNVTDMLNNFINNKL